MILKNQHANRILSLIPSSPFANFVSFFQIALYKSEAIIQIALYKFEAIIQSSFKNDLMRTNLFKVISV